MADHHHERRRDSDSFSRPHSRREDSARDRNRNYPDQPLRRRSSEHGSDGAREPKSRNRETRESSRERYRDKIHNRGSDPMDLDQRPPRKYTPSPPPRRRSDSEDFHSQRRETSSKERYRDKSPRLRSRSPPPQRSPNHQRRERDRSRRRDSPGYGNRDRKDKGRESRRYRDERERLTERPDKYRGSRGHGIRDHRSRQSPSLSRSPPRRRHPPQRSRSRSRDPPRDKRREPALSHSKDLSRRHRRSRSHSTGPPAGYKRSGPLPSQETALAQANGDEPPIEKQKPDYSRSGKLAAETNTVQGTSVVLKYNEPPEARKPPASADWRLYVFKDKEVLETVPLGERSCWLFGRERAVADFPVEHPSCSKQHAVVQFRHVEKRAEDGSRKGGVKPYVIDLGSANGTKMNGERVPEQRFVEIKSGDMLGFGDSTREYVIMLAPKG